MQLLLIRHALPQRSELGQGADPELSETGVAQANRLPTALERFPIARVLSSPQRRAVATAAPLAESRGLSVEVDERLAEYDRGHSEYLPLEQLRTERPDQWARIAAGRLPVGVDETVFLSRIADAITDLTSLADHTDTVAVVSHGGVINALLHRVLGTERILAFQIDYASVTRLLCSRSGAFSVAEVNGTAHVWDLLPRNQNR
ncbi:histidine phosphatase family protein [Mycolicibacterium brumae]|uniref:Histidine phosphatase family protein n=1 Tax=Mycolicibacterium brumae TaxID=85968 RepID=A0A2G5PD60_9MYCO|nr:histidine phosphatase family protein [Mycolicibacterium brumae]MCV7191856.1 histidine phosphatase family protein [Mycolicibacterium brumae]PIB76266.1 histidine phosphatase family protein [Mycolicibacterium brumae]RWA15765.1 hypothetical protein MBRU_09445 [Mycolicibacterium brumae DSM 44177]UWW07162.1 histidine phosphatase family protein [Mycolicibacterium brumae]